MLLNCSENEKLYAKSVPVSIKDACSKRTTHLFLTIEWQDTPDGIYSKKALVLSLTDNDDPFFLYNLYLSDEDFETLKVNQDLLISFPSFPEHIIDYVEKALREENNPQPKFILLFTVNGSFGSAVTHSQLDIIETNEFKNLIHLSLKFIAATESTVKQYLVTCFRNLKEERRQLQHKINFIEQDFRDKITVAQNALSNKAQELDSVKQHMSIELSQRDKQHALKLQEEKDRLLQRQREEKNKCDTERIEREQHFSRKIQELGDKVFQLDSFNKDLQEKNQIQESTITNLRSQVFSLQNEIKQLKESSQSYKQKYDHILTEMKENQSYIHRQGQNIQDLEQELRNKNQCISRLKEDFESMSMQKKANEVDLDRVKLQLEMSEKSRKMFEDEKLKTNEIILKLQQRVKAAVEKGKSKGELCSKQEKKIEEKDNLLEQLRSEMFEITRHMDSKNIEVKSLTDSVSSLQNKVDHLERELKAKTDVIKYLNHQLTNRYVFPTMTQENHETSPSSVAQKQLEKIQCGRKSTSPSNPPVVNSASKPVRKDTPCSNKKSSHTPPCLQATATTDSAYCTSPSGYTHQTTSEGQFRNGMNLNRTDLDIDPSAWSATFGDGAHNLKHSTAKKQTNTAKSTIPKSSRWR